MFSEGLSIREANLEDIPHLHYIRMAVKENILSDPGLVREKDYEPFLTTRGKGWLCEYEGLVLGFAIVDMKINNVWALFIHPEHEGKGIGKRLQKIMLDWYFERNPEPIWLGTSPGTRAEQFYRRTGWIETGMHGKEIKFEMQMNDWKIRSQIFSSSK